MLTESPDQPDTSLQDRHGTPRERHPAPPQSPDSGPHRAATTDPGDSTPEPDRYRSTRDSDDEHGPSNGDDRMSSRAGHHEAMRESLGAYLLGHLDRGEDTVLRAHLDRCQPCRAELAELAPLVAPLALVDPDAVDPDDPDAPARTRTPPPELGAAIARLRAERDTAPRPAAQSARTLDGQAVDTDGAAGDEEN